MHTFHYFIVYLGIIHELKVHHCCVEVLFLNSVNFKHLICKNCLLNYNLNQFFLFRLNGVLLVLQHCLGSLKLPLLRFEEDLLYLLASEVRSFFISRFTHLSLHELLLSLWICHIVLMSVQELLLI